MAPVCGTVHIYDFGLRARAASLLCDAWIRLIAGATGRLGAGLPGAIRSWGKFSQRRRLRQYFAGSPPTINSGGRQQNRGVELVVSGEAIGSPVIVTTDSLR